MSDLDKLLQIVTTVHDSTLEPSLWPQALTLVGEILNSNGVVLALDDQRRGFANSFEGATVPEARLAYLTEFHTIDPVIAFVRRAPAKRAYSDDMTIARDVLERTRFHTDFAARFDYAQCMQAFTHRSAAASGFFVSARSIRQNPFEEADRTLLERLLPHFEQALRLRALLHQADLERQSALAALDGVKEGVILVDAALKILFFNAEARRLLRSGTGLIDSGSKLATTLSSDYARLRSAVAKAVTSDESHSPAAFTVSRSPPQRALLVRVSPVSAAVAERIEDLVAGALVFVGDPDAAQIDPALVAASLGLTPAEAQVSSLLATGMDLHALTRRLHVSEATVRTHLQHIFAKTQTAQQSQLVALVNAIPGRSAHSSTRPNAKS